MHIGVELQYDHGRARDRDTTQGLPTTTVYDSE